MATKAVAMQFVGTLRSRPNATGGAEAGPTFSSADDTGLIVRSGSYNRPPNPGETVFTSERACLTAMLSVSSKMQIGLGQNVRITVYGKPVGVVPTNAARALTTAELAEQVYAECDTVSAGLHDAVKYANQIPNTSGLVIRSEAGPEAEISSEAVSGA